MVGLVGVFTMLCLPLTPIFFFFFPSSWRNQITVEQQLTYCGAKGKKKKNTLKVLSVNLTLLSAVFTLYFNGDRLVQILTALDK